MARRMASSRFRREQEEGRYLPHVRPINEFVDVLRDPGGRGWLPYVAPWHGGVEARVLSVLRDPGPMTRDGSGSGFLCIENDDATAERQAEDFAAVGIRPRDVTPWNAYPWYINRKPSAVELEAGVEPLMELLRLMPVLRVVLLQGRDAQDGWQRLLRRHPSVERARGLKVINTYHPSRQALWARDPAIRAARVADRQHAYRAVAEAIQSS